MPASGRRLAREWGRLPNVHWGHSLTLQQLRDDPSIPFQALPPVEQLALAGPESHRYVRQDDQLWTQLHDGVLTTGLVRGALGLYEKSAVKKLGISSSRAGHGELLRAYHHLQQQTAADGGSSGSCDAATTAAAAAHNAAAVAAYHTAKAAARETSAAAAAAATAAAARSRGGRQGPCLAAAPAPAAAGGGVDGAAGASKHARRRQRKQQAKAAAAALGESAFAPELQAAAGGAAAAAAAPWGLSEDHKLRKARSLGSLGLMSICCSWGQAQEAATLLQVATAFRDSQLAEVGLCRLQQELLPAEWGFAPGSLPAIGASPDALIRHRMPAAGRLAAAAGGAAAAEAAGVGVGAAATDAGGGAAASAAASAAAAGPPAAAAGGSWDIEGLLSRLQLAGDPSAAAVPATDARSSMPATNGSSTAGGGSSSSSSSGYLIEVVEVKNTCPFGHSRRGGRLRTTEFAVSDRGPRHQVVPEWVPQLQMHMLCAGTPSGLLVSRSATKGTRVFRMHRDDQLLRLMLLVISRLWQKHVLPGRPPPPDVYTRWREHHDMLRRIGEVARGAELVAVLEDADPTLHRFPAGDTRWFLD